MSSRIDIDVHRLLMLGYLLALAPGADVYIAYASFSLAMYITVYSLSR